MSIIHLDSCDHYDSATSYTKWSGSVTVNDAGRTGKCVQGGTKLFNVQSILAVGAASYLTGYGSDILFGLGNSAGISFNIRYLSDTRFYAQIYNNNLSINGEYSLITTLRTNQWFYLEIYAVHTVSYIGTTATSHVNYILRINEEVILSGDIEHETTGYGPTTLGFTQVGFVGVGSSMLWDDIYITDGEFLGDVKIYVIRPNDEGDVIDWTPTGGTTHYTEVDDSVPDLLTTMISSDTIGQIDMVNLEDINYAGEIKGIQINAIADKDEAGGAAFVQYNKVSNTIFESAADIYAAYLSWFDFTCAYRINPITNVDFTNAEINAMQIGVKRTI